MQILLITLFFSCLLLILHDIGLSLFLYWTFRWFDLFVHGIGGFTVGSFLFFFFEHRPHFFFAGALALILCWELFEVFVVRIPVEGVFYVIDTVTDIAIGVAGILVARFLLRRL